MPLCRKNRVVAGVAGGGLHSAIDPSLKVCDGIDDPAAYFGVAWAGAVAAVLL
jgi:hypothetical protein